MNEILRALQQAGVVDEKKANQIRHEEKVRKKQLGRDGRSKERKERKQRHDDRRRGGQQQVQSAQEAHNRAEGEKREAKSLIVRIEEEAVEAQHARRRFHYRAPDGTLPAIPVDERLSKQLEAGELALVQSPSRKGRVRIVPRALALEVQRSRPELVLHGGD